ncbi:MAG: WD40 repeat domain-containing protein [Tildeniella nuda ZEHNDER 1965/U140]|jgi:WD40 repeat protein|nr:WD40 repeat domain-containing protein [Tildeniella nuda ZEHNDER 1965/U140]
MSLARLGCTQITFSPNGILLASSSPSDDDPTINIWTMNGLKSELVNQLSSKHDKQNDLNATPPNLEIHAISFSPDSQTLASASEDHTIRLWQVSNGRRRVLRGHKKGVKSIAFSPDGQTLASASDDKTIKLWHVSDGKEIWSQLGGTHEVSSVNFSPDGKTLVSGDVKGTLSLWDVKDKVFLYKLQGHQRTVRSVRFSPDGQMLISGSEDESIRLWDLNLDSLARLYPF